MVEYLVFWEQTHGAIGMTDSVTPRKHGKNHLKMKLIIRVVMQNMHFLTYPTHIFLLPQNLSTGMYSGPTGIRTRAALSVATLSTRVLRFMVQLRGHSRALMNGLANLTGPEVP